MATKNRFQELMADSKNRVVFLVGGSILLIIILYFLFSGQDSSNLDDVSGRSSISSLNTKISSTPGLGKQSKEYQEIAYEDNKKRSMDARKTGGSAVPTLVGNQVVGKSVVQTRREDEKRKKAEDANRRYEELLNRRREESLRAQLRAAQANQQGQGANASGGAAGNEKRMEKQAKALFALWGAPPQMQTERGKAQPDNVGPGQGGNVDDSNTGVGPQDERIIYKAGDVVFAVIDTAINSDEPGPIMGRIVEGPLRGAKILGKFEPASGHDAQKLKLTFTLMNIPEMPRSIAFNAIAIDPETARTAISTDVDNHYLLRYGSMLASSFLEGMSDAVLSSLSNGGIEQQDGAFVFSTVEATTRDQIISGLGNVGKKIGEKTDFFDRPPTITIDPGTGIGLLITSDFNLLAPPASNYNLNSTGPTRATTSNPDDSVAGGAPPGFTGSEGS